MTIPALLHSLGHGIDRSALDEMFHVEAVAKLTVATDFVDAALEGWIASAVDRLSAIMEGRHRDFDLNKDDVEQEEV